MTLTNEIVATMSEEHLRCFILEKLGSKSIREDGLSHIPACFFDEETQDGRVEVAPDYATDLNALRSLWLEAGAALRWAHNQCLRDAVRRTMTGLDPTAAGWRLEEEVCNASARLRAEAWVIVLDRYAYRTIEEDPYIKI
jgi:hypothetical protein